MASDRQPLHFVLVPWLAQGHMIPMIDIARLLAARTNISVTIITTPVNASRIQATIDRISAANLPIRFLPIRFPATEVGLPEGCENLDSLPSLSLVNNFFTAAELMKQPLLDHLHHHPPSCLITDMGHPWTRDVARELGVPRFIFHGFSCFSILSIENLILANTRESALSDTDKFPIPGVPHKVEIARGQLPSQFQRKTDYSYIQKKIREGEVTADGYIVNSFHELEPEYAEYLERATGKKVWMIGPVSLFNKGKDISQRGNKSAVDETQCLTWLDSKKPRSVIYVSFGSLASFKPAQLKELGMGLLSSNQYFVWVIREAALVPEFEEWLSENTFKESRCLVIRGWAPQVMILSHPSVGGFLTHCGWNSTLEGAAAGVPMATWPLFAEQFLNEKVIVDVLGIGVSVGVEKRNGNWGGEDGDVVVVGREKVEAAVRELMCGGQGEERRIKAKELSERAHRALEEGQSSYLDMSYLVEYVESHGANRV